MKILRLFIVALALLSASAARAAPSHFYIPAKFCHAYPGTNAVIFGDTGGADPKPVWKFPSGINTANAVLCEVWYPESATTNSFTVDPTFRGNSADVAKNACWLTSWNITLVNGDWSANLGGGGSNPALISQAMGANANKDQHAPMTGLQAIDDADGVTTCVPGTCKNNHGQLFLQRQIQVNCTAEVPVTLEMEGLDVQWTP